MFLPCLINQLYIIESLEMESNRFLQGTLPPEIVNLAQLKVLKVQGTDIIGGIPSQVCALPNLVSFQVNCDLQCPCCMQVCP